jgi:hypothetical protein
MYSFGNPKDRNAKIFFHIEFWIAIVDDWNFPEVPLGTKAAFEKLNYRVLFEVVLPAQHNGDVANWWNGLYVAVIHKPKVK